MENPSKPPLLLVGHGTRDAQGVAEFTAFVERMRRRMPVDVAGGFIELSPPPLTEAVAELHERGHRRIAAVPLVLAAAGHGKGDIPAAMAREQVRRPGLSYVYGRPLGPHPILLELLEERLRAVCPPGGGTAVLLVGRGSTDPDANAEVHKVARLFWEGRGAGGPGQGPGLSTVETAFVSLAAPGVPEGLERCRRLGARRIVVLPYFLFPGVLPDRVAAQARRYAAGHPELDVRCAEVIGDCDGLADLVAERYAEALAGDIRMNCDTCVYRIALPGFEDRVGAPQTPHHHPDDPAHGHGHGHWHQAPGQTGGRPAVRCPETGGGDAR
ncbi:MULTISPECIES: sirohydrochlorin chelatase [Thermomonospora]|uniref:Cobalamin (Vitamin B12) biosynthesis CbiX protein n=1 Tax=Thermomonospora curvata (strain ATCC 19995 / DSM 43183 / JCM 3096 / KCTC 9072 / NBRC 15933 / NCIMB 10081 / Henssen B9) TaxID=471852 RepID=D1A9W7_THECD|nr:MULTISPECIES: sirohydrochlorin chelatase [Thermomonospora]ACY96903.1 cobalamin (vitamin B12) biosynthesis CbiX protein [Thermomonospora curvata DSM 43183]PKK15186.1 MAG: sirohydrochlorin chelatase [Thermomonospora sp. CIF 1]